MQRNITVVLTTNMEIRGAYYYGPRYSEDTDSYTIQLDFNTFYALLAPNSRLTFGTDIFQEHLHWWGTDSTC